MSRALPDLDETTRWYVERLGLALRSRLGDGLVSLVLYGSRARTSSRHPRRRATTRRCTST